MRRAVTRRWVIEVPLTSNEPWLWLNFPSTESGEYQWVSAVKSSKATTVDTINFFMFLLWLSECSG
jgi:hypothetical protein